MVAKTPAISFVAKSGTGKTSLLVSVIRELSQRGFAVGVIKHDAHRFEIDHEGKDSWRLTQAGASPTVISSPEKLALVRTGLEEEVSLGEIISRYMDGVDLVLTEGYKTGRLPKIEVHRAERSPELLCVSGDGEVLDRDLVAVVSDADLAVPVPLLPLNEPAAVCDFIAERFIVSRNSRS